MFGLIEKHKMLPVVPSSLDLCAGHAFAWGTLRLWQQGVRAVIRSYVSSRRRRKNGNSNGLPLALVLVVAAIVVLVAAAVSSLMLLVL